MKYGKPVSEYQRKAGKWYGLRIQKVKGYNRNKHGSSHVEKKHGRCPEESGLTVNVRSARVSAEFVSGIFFSEQFEQNNGEVHRTGDIGGKQYHNQEKRHGFYPF
jgi:hypothetical protein